MKLSIENLYLEYPDGNSKISILEDVNFTAETGETATILGASGSGKSSLIYLVSTLRAPTSGRVLLDGVDITNAKNKASVRYDNFGFIFQQHFLIPYYTVLENVLLTRNRKKYQSDALALLDDLEILRLKDRKPHEISGGERQRVAIARALLSKPKVLFADEPTASLDVENAQIIYNLLMRQAKNSILIMCTHDLSLLHDDTRIFDIKHKGLIERVLVHEK